jgi:hypothetical protein
VGSAEGEAELIRLDAGGSLGVIGRRTTPGGLLAEASYHEVAAAQRSEEAQMEAGTMMATCSKCGEVKPGPTPVAKTGEPRPPFVCSE